MNDFKILVKSTSEQWELPFDDFSFTEELNNDRFATVNFNLAGVSGVMANTSRNIEYILTASYREIEIYFQEDLLYAGYISEVQFDSEGRIGVNSKGFFSLLEKRFTDATPYTAVDAGQIAWNIIDYTQGLTNGNLGITRGSAPSSVNRDRTLKYDSIAEVIRNLSNTNLKNGFDFEITNDKVFNVFYPQKGTILTDLVLEEGFNIESFSIVRTFMDSMANQVIVLGANQGDAQKIVVRDAESIYKETFYLLQSKLSEIDVSETSTLQDKGDKFLDKYKFPRSIIQSLTTTYDDLPFTDFTLGDSIKIKIPTYNIDSYFRINKRTLKDDKTVTLNFAII